MDDLGAYEARFRRAGLPLLIEDYSAREDVFTRAFGLLAFVAIAEVLGALNLEWSLAANVAAVAGALGFLLGGFALVNRLRGRPALARPQAVDPPELAGFVLVPALLPVVFNGQVTSALVTAGGNALLVALVWLVVGFGLPSIVRWAAARLVAQLSVAVTLLARAIPLLMLFAVVLFINTEVWQVFSSMPDATLAATAGLLVLIGVAFLSARLPREVAQLERDVGSGPPLRRLQRVNVALVLFVSQGLQVLVVSAAIGGFFVVFGLLAIDASIQESWLGSAGDAHVTFDALGREMRLTPELLRVAIGIASLAGLYYAIAVFIDPAYREEFLDELTGELRDTFEARAAYLAARA